MPTYGGGPNPPVRLDPWQNIVGVHWPDREGYACFRIRLNVGYDNKVKLGAGCTRFNSDPIPQGSAELTFNWTESLVYSYTDPNKWSNAFRWDPDAGFWQAVAASVSGVADDPGEFDFGPENEIFVTITDLRTVTAGGGSIGPSTVPGSDPAVSFSAGLNVTLGFAGYRRLGTFRCIFNYFPPDAPDPLGQGVGGGLGYRAEIASDDSMHRGIISLSSLFSGAMTIGGDEYTPIGAAWVDDLLFLGPTLAHSSNYRLGELWILCRRGT